MIICYGHSRRAQISSRNIGLGFEGYQLMKTTGYMTDTEVEDGKNVLDAYRIVKDLASIVMIHYTVNI